MSDTANRFDQLTPTERQCLRLVAQGLTSDEIARGVGISSGVVDNRILDARRKLGGMSRRAAARMLVKFEGAEGVHPLHLQSMHLDQHTPIGPVPPCPAPLSAPDRVRLERTPFAHQPPNLKEAADGELSKWTRLRLTAWIAAGIAIVALAAPQLAAGFKALSKIVSLIF